MYLLEGKHSILDISETISILDISGSISTNHGTKHPWMEEFHFYSNDRPYLSPY